jgi:hypothetical protein
MSATIPPLPTRGTTIPTSAPITPAGRDRLIAEARTLPGLIAAAQVSDPALAEQLTGKALVYSRTVWGTPIVMVVSWAASRYALGWDPATCSAVAGALTWAAVIALRAITKAPISGVLTPSTTGPKL